MGNIEELDNCMLYTIQIMLKLTQSELEILYLLKDGKNRKDIAKLRFVEESTVKKQINILLKKFNKSGCLELVSWLEKKRVFEILSQISMK